MTVKFLADYPAVFISDEKALVIAELHLGLEYEIFKSGITIPPQREKFLETLDSLLEITRAKKLILVGDIKHKVPGSTIREDIEIPKFLEQISSKVKTIIVKGNHDDRIEEILPKNIKIYSSHGFRIKKYGFFHGHAWPSKVLMKCDYLFMGHIHPAIEFRDEFGHRNSEKVWIKGRMNLEKVKKKFKLTQTGKLNIIIIPTFNNILGGTAVNRVADEEKFSPLVASEVLDLNTAKIYLLDGTFLGILENIKKFRQK
jgi:putative SbcD/Mre11-related phosphoesterase